MAAAEKSKPEVAPKKVGEPSDMLGIQAAAAASGFVLTGTMLGILVSMPVLLDTNTDGLQLCRQWAGAFRYGHILGPTLCGATTLLHLLAASRSRTHPWTTGSKASRWQLAAALTTVGMVPFTWVALTSTNNSLFALLANASADLVTVQHLVRTWSRLHFVRCMFPFFGAILGLGIIVQRPA